jgi:hypothetical protein
MAGKRPLILPIRLHCMTLGMRDIRHHGEIEAIFALLPAA